MRFTFPPAYLFQKADFNLLFKVGKKKFGSFFVIYFRPLDGTERADFRRFGLVVGKKATGNNVKRNLTKRLIRESYRLKQHQLTQFQVMVLATKKVKGTDRKLLRAELDRLWECIQ